MSKSYMDMTVANLRALCAERGVNVPKTARKADMADLLAGWDAAAAEDAAEDSAEAVQAEVIDEAGGLSVSYHAGAISANFDALEARVDAILAEYEGWEPDHENPDDLKAVKAAKGYLKSLYDNIEVRRKTVKKEYLRPLDEFDQRASGISKKVKAVRDRLSEVEKHALEQYKTWKKGQLREFYEDYAGLLAEVVPYERIHDDRWLLKGTNVEKAKEEIAAVVEKAAGDREALKQMGLPFEAEALRVFYGTLDFGEAVKHARKLEEDQKRVEAMEAELAAYEAAQEQEPSEGTAPAAEPEPRHEPQDQTTTGQEHTAYAPEAYQPVQPYQPSQAYEPARQYRPQPEPAETVEALIDRAIELSGGMVRPVLQAVLNRVPLGFMQNDDPRPCVAEITEATTRQMDLIGRCMGGIGCTARFYRGDMPEAYRIWCAENVPEGGQYA